MVVVLVIVLRHTSDRTIVLSGLWLIGGWWWLPVGESVQFRLPVCFILCFHLIDLWWLFCCKLIELNNHLCMVVYFKLPDGNGISGCWLGCCLYHWHEAMLCIWSDHTRTSLLRTLNTGEQGEWLLPETKEVLERQWQRQKEGTEDNGMGNIFS